MLIKVEHFVFTSHRQGTNNNLYLDGGMMSSVFEKDKKGAIYPRQEWLTDFDLRLTWTGLLYLNS